MENKITQAQFIDCVSLRTGDGNKDVERILKAAGEEIKIMVKDGVAVPFPVIGKFFPHDAPERMGRNPKTGETHMIPAKRVLKFKASATVDLNK